MGSMIGSELKLYIEGEKLDKLDCLKQLLPHERLEYGLGMWQSEPEWASTEIIALSDFIFETLPLCDNIEELS